MNVDYLKDLTKGIKMKKWQKKTSKGILFGFVLFFVVGCGLIDVNDVLTEEPQTQELMEGVWLVTDVVDENGNSFVDELAFPFTAFQLGSANSMISTSGPLTTYLVYGESNYTKAASKMDKLFDYLNLKFLTGGEYFIEGGEVERFTLETKLEGAPGTSTLKDILQIFGLSSNLLKTTIYHRFTDVRVSFVGEKNDTMQWEFDGDTEGYYFIKDGQGKEAAWSGWDAKKFTRCTITMVKKSKTIKEMLEEQKVKKH